MNEDTKRRIVQAMIVTPWGRSLLGIYLRLLVWLRVKE